MFLQRIFLIIGILFFGLSSAQAAISADEAKALFVQANQAYKDGEDVKAIELYEKVIQGGLASGALYYNLANSYVKINQAGKAIVNYKRAQRIMPRDNDLKLNYEFALSSIPDYSSESSSDRLRKIVKDFLDFYSLEELAVLTLILFAAAGIIFLGGMYFQGTGFARPLGVIVLLIVGIVFAFGAYAKYQEEKSTAVIIVKTEARFEPLDSAKIYFEIPEGNEVSMLSSEGMWVKIQRKDGRLGWVKAEALERI